MSSDDPFDEEMVDPFSETMEEYVEYTPLCRCGSTPRSNDDVDRWKEKHLACYAKQRKRDKERAIAEVKAAIAYAKLRPSQEQPGAITVSVIEACPFAHEVVDGVKLFLSEPEDEELDCNCVICCDCLMSGPNGKAKEAIEKWNARRKV